MITPYRPTFLEILNTLLSEAQKGDQIKVRTILHMLEGRGVASLLILFSLPFCLPIQIPGFSTPFGVILALVGLRIALARRPWWPEWILERELSSKSLETLVHKTVWSVKLIQKFSHPRLFVISRNEFIHRFNGFLVFLLAVFLSLPLPIPFTNMLSAFPILLLGIGFLEEDGVFLLLGQLFSLLTFLFFGGLFLIGNAYISQF